MLGWASKLMYRFDVPLTSIFLQLCIAYDKLMSLIHQTRHTKTCVLWLKIVYICNADLGGAAPFFPPFLSFFFLRKWQIWFGKHKVRNLKGWKKTIIIREKVPSTPFLPPKALRRLFRIYWPVIAKSLFRIIFVCRIRIFNRFLSPLVQIISEIFGKLKTIFATHMIFYA